MTRQGHTGLPHETADRITKPFARFLKVEAAAAGLLLVAVLVALILVNSAWSTAFLAFWETPIGLHFGGLDFSRSLRDWINDRLMTFFFFVISLELKREIVFGELRSVRTAMLPIAAALGGMLVPVSLYLALSAGKTGAHRWGTEAPATYVVMPDGELHGTFEDGFAVELLTPEPRQLNRGQAAE